MYAHTPNRDWESDSDIDKLAQGELHGHRAPADRVDVGDGFEVVLGGGRSYFLPKTMADPEYPDKTGDREDGQDLTAEWLNRYGNQQAAYVWNREGFEAPTRPTRPAARPLRALPHAVRGRPQADEPSLAEMTAKAIDILSKNTKGFFLMVEGGRIDHAHHAGNAAAR